MYGRSGSLRYLIGLGLTIILLIFVIVLIVHHHPGKSKVPVTQAVLTSLSNNPTASVRETIDGPVTAPVNHNEVQITISNTATNFELLQGYDGNVIGSQSYPMTETAFNVFLSSLEHAGFTDGTTVASLQDDRGYCPTGSRYIFEVMQNGKDVERFWTTSCGSPRTFKGDAALVSNLFEVQVPDYGTLTTGANLNDY